MTPEIKTYQRCWRVASKCQGKLVFLKVKPSIAVQMFEHHCGTNITGAGHYTWWQIVIPQETASVGMDASGSQGWQISSMNVGFSSKASLITGDFCWIHPFDQFWWMLATFSSNDRWNNNILTDTQQQSNLIRTMSHQNTCQWMCNWRCKDQKTAAPKDKPFLISSPMQYVPQTGQKPL